MEFTWLRKIDFFPPWLETFNFATLPPSLPTTLCIGTKSRNLGDALALTTLPEKLKAKHPDLTITTYPRGFNTIVFQNNPAVSHTQYIPRALYGDDINLGSGHLIQLKERFFDLPLSTPARPKIHLSGGERIFRDRMLLEKMLPGNESKPLCVIHPWGTTRSSVATHEFWDSLIQRWSYRYRFWQVGVQAQPAIVGCEFYFFTRPKPQEARKLFGLLSGAQRFIGVDSGPMHVARAFDIPSAVLVGHSEKLRIAERLERCSREPYFLNHNWKFTPLYPDNLHIDVAKGSELSAGRQLDEWLETYFS